MGLFYNTRVLKERRRALRRGQTDSERVLWRHLRSRQLDGYKFYRQYSVGPYILDFYCPVLRLAIELDGGQHAEAKHLVRDAQRTAYLKEYYISVTRFWDNDVLQNIDGVIDRITSVMNDLANPLSPPLCKGGGNVEGIL